MIKDPLFKEQTPYEFLGLERNMKIQTKDIHNFLANFMKNPENRTKISAAMEMLKKLKVNSERIQIDLMFYSIEDIDISEIQNKINIGNYFSKINFIKTFDPYEYLMQNIIDIYSFSPAQINITESVSEEEEYSEEFAAFHFKNNFVE